MRFSARTGSVTGPVSVVSWGPGRLDIFGVNSGGAVQHLWYDPTITGWGSWEDKGGSGPVSVVSWGPYRLDIFGLHQAAVGLALQHLWYG
jgi:hypothetical protein